MGFMRRFPLFLVFFTVSLLLSLPAGSHTLDTLHIDVMLHVDGSADLTERRKYQITEEGTEGFIAFESKDGIRASQFAVTDETGFQYEVDYHWDVKRTRNQKYRRCGYLRTTKGVELCWGLGDTGSRTYIISYHLDYLVQGYEDYDALYYYFFRAEDTPPRYVSISIEMDGTRLSHGKAGIWTFGYHGKSGFFDGKMLVETLKPMKDGEKIVVLAQFKKRVFRPVWNLPVKFEETVKPKAFEGSDYGMVKGLGDRSNVDAVMSSLSEGGGQEHSFQWFVVLFKILKFFFSLGSTGFSLLVLIVILIAAGVLKVYDWIEGKVIIKQLVGTKKLGELPYYRNLPINGSLLQSYGVLRAVDSMSGEALMSHKAWSNMQQLYNACLLRLFYQKKIALNVDEFGDEVFYISQPEILTDKEFDQNVSQLNELNDDSLELLLLNLLYEAAGDDHMLQKGELRMLVADHPLRWRDMAKTVYDLIEQGADKHTITSEDTLQVVGFLNYLKDFDKVGDSSLADVEVGKEYVVFATLFGIADKVRKDMRQVCPSLRNLDESTWPTKTMPMFTLLSADLWHVTDYAHNYESPQEREAREKDEASLRDSGGGGFSSFSGGGSCSSGSSSGTR